MPAPLAVRQIAIASGRRLAVAPALAEEVLFVRLKDASVDTVLSHIAEVLCAKWKTRADGITWLAPDPEAVRKIEKSEADEDDLRLSDSLKYLQKRLALQPKELDQKAVEAYIQKKKAQDDRISDAEARNDYSHVMVGSSANQESPAWRALARIVLQIDPKVLLGIPMNGREVWAENPTQMQHGFPDEANEVLKTYRRELSILDPTLVAKRVKLIFKKSDIMSAFNVNLEAVGLDGKQVDRAVARLNSYADQMKPPDRQDPKPDEAPLQPSAEVMEARKALAAFYQGPDRRAIFTKWRAKILDPVHFEPLTWGLGEELMMAAESVDRNLVGSANDGYATSEELLTNLTASHVLMGNRESFLPTDDGLLVFRSHERMKRSSRSKVKTLLANCVQLGGITVDLAANWSAQSTDEWSFLNWVGEYVGLVCTHGGRYGADSTMMSDVNLRLWADIGSAGIDSLRRGGVLQISRLSPTAKAQLDKNVFWGNLDDGTDPTDRLPNGIIDGTVTMSIDESPVFFGWANSEGSPVAPRPVDATEFGASLVRGDRWEEVPASVIQKYDRFRVGVNRKYTLNFILEPGAIPMVVPLRNVVQSRFPGCFRTPRRPESGG